MRQHKSDNLFCPKTPQNPSKIDSVTEMAALVKIQEQNSLALGPQVQMM